ncbi:hypothetical protein BASA61_000718 [Batrachochytrium salamandrivorans]|nr:hypothetical protein BASA61_000718 [Batrachochytrium salamandrivorans]KAH9247734.1 hypothetical protein BASA81_014662 [Batrachochytrium salamandrivorans]KAH9275537.1 hypothetical protein BASA83_001819 [Batrachochytrium salamandrivorans]
MKLAAATLFSLVAIATYALPAAYPENRVDMQYSAINEPIIVHLERRAGDQQRFPETIEDTQKSADYKRRLQKRQNQQQRLRQQEEDQRQMLREREKQQRPERWRHQQQQQEQQQRLREQDRKQKSEVEYQESKSREKALQDWKANWASGVRNYDCRNGRLVSPQDFPRDKRPNRMGPSEKVVSQIGATNQKKGDRFGSRENTATRTAPNTRSEQNDSSYQSQEAEDRRRMQSEEGKKCHLEYMRSLKTMQKHGSVGQRSQERIGMTTRIRDLPGPVPKVIETEPHKPLKSILKKGQMNPGHGRRVKFNPLDQVATYDRSKNQPPFDIRKIPSKSITHTTDE